MVVAADDGVMPQTREHAAVLAALGVTRGRRRGHEGRPRRPGAGGGRGGGAAAGRRDRAPCRRAPARGWTRCARALERVGRAGVEPRAATGPLRLHVDRVVHVRGAGTVVTGTLWSGDGRARRPRSRCCRAGVAARVRGVQVHDEPVERAAAGQRVALNLAGVGARRGRRAATSIVGRGGGAGAPTYPGRRRADLGRRPTRGRTRRAGRRPPRHARVAPRGWSSSAGGSSSCGSSSRSCPLAGDRLVIRSLAPPDTLGGGVVLDPAPRRHGPSRDLLARLARLERGEPEPEAPPAAPAPEPEPRRRSARAALALEARLRAAGHEPPLDADLGDAGELAALRAHGRAVRLGRDDAHPPRRARRRRRSGWSRLIERDGEITLAGLRDELGTSRKYAQALLEHFDGDEGDAAPAAHVPGVLRRRRRGRAARSGPSPAPAGARAPCSSRPPSTSSLERSTTRSRSDIVATSSTCSLMNHCMNCSLV